MTWTGVALQAIYFTLLGLLATYGVHRLSLVVLYLRRRPPQRRPRAITSPPARPWPRVTVQLPIYNERYVLERLIEAVCALDYPPERLEIQVLDDSDDGTSALSAELVATHRRRGHDIHHVRRRHRRGYKAGALAEGLAAARGSLIAIFDADFVPPADFLRRAVPRFLDPGNERLGMVQARWGHLNRDHSMLTRAQALLLDGHFVVEHGARSLTGRFFNFNGTAGVFRRRCIEEAGGWQDDTLTEDLDLSYRAQLAGWRFEYLADLVVPAELPVEVNALKSQQRRWTMGSVQTAMKLIGSVLSAPLHPVVKCEAVVHLTNNAAYLLLAALSMVIVPALAARGDRPLTYLYLDLPLFLAGTGSFALQCAVAQRATRPDWKRSLIALPALMAIGIGISLNNALAVLAALAGGTEEFRRTPKYRIDPARDRGGDWKRLAYRGRRSALLVAEAAAAVLFWTAVATFAEGRLFWGLPFLVLFASGFSYLTLLSLAQDVSRVRLRSVPRRGAAPTR